jgi:hypothetical protein
MKTEYIVMFVLALILGMLLAHMFKNVCGCKNVVEGGDESQGQQMATAYALKMKKMQEYEPPPKPLSPEAQVAVLKRAPITNENKYMINYFNSLIFPGPDKPSLPCGEEDQTTCTEYPLLNMNSISGYCNVALDIGDENYSYLKNYTLAQFCPSKCPGVCSADRGQ